MNIKISEQHGLNPTLGICFYCGKETGEIGLLGKLAGDREAPRHAVLSYNPCKKCEKKFKKGVLIIAVTPSDNKNTWITKGYKPTGQYAVVKAEAINNKHRPGSTVVMHQNEFEQMFGSNK